MVCNLITNDKHKQNINRVPEKLNNQEHNIIFVRKLPVRIVIMNFNSQIVCLYNYHHIHMK